MLSLAEWFLGGGFVCLHALERNAEKCLLHVADIMDI